MKHSEFTLNARDRIHLFGQLWEPDGEAKAIVCLVHGLGEHSGRYSHVAQFLCGEGFTLQAVDLRGHGRSQGKRGYIPSYDTVMDDIEFQINDARLHFPTLPLFLYGHSLGGTIVLNYVLRRKPRITGVIATGPGFRPAFTPPGWKVNLGKFLYNLWPSVLMNNSVDRRALSRDTTVVQAYIHDPLVHDRLSARLGIDLLSTGEWAIVHAGELTVPVLLMHGTADGLVSANASKEFAEKAGTLCTLKLWDGLYHEIHNEPEKEVVLAFMIDWMNKLLG